MKKNYFIILLLTSLSIGAQPVLRQANFPTSYSAYGGDAIPPDEPAVNLIGNPGPDQVWDFSALQISMCCSMKSISLVPLTSTLYAPYFPTANYCYKITEDNRPNIYEYYNLTATTFEQMGGGADFGPSIFNPRHSIYQFPYEFNAQVNGTDVESSVYDAYGTLVGPMDSGTFTDVIRKKTTYVGDAVVYYSWYNTNPYYLLAEAKVMADDTLFTVYFSTASGSMGFDQNVKEAAVRIFPNPASSVLHLQIAGNSLVDKITIEDMTGKRVMERTTDFSSLDIQDLAKGIYLLSAYSGKDKYQTKFIKE